MNKGNKAKNAVFALIFTVLPYQLYGKKFGRM